MDDDAEVFKNIEKNPLAEFKKPVVIGKRPGTKSSQPLKSVNPKPDLVVQTNKQNEEQVTESLNKNPKQQLQTTPQQAPIFSAPKNSVLNYTPPPSSHKCSIPYQLEVLKDGVIIEVKELQEISKSYIVFGRLPTCDIPLHHPSISRYHAVLQYKCKDDQGNVDGWYLFDLGSTHGTLLNKRQILPNIYSRVHSGYVFKFGGSSRLFILQGPEEDQDPLSQIEMKPRQPHAKQSYPEDSDSSGVDSVKLITPSSNSSSGIDWGMKEDAEDDNPSSENPFAVLDEGHLNETFYLDDPKRTLRGWFEREGYELEYKVEEKSYAFFVCRVELPIHSSGSRGPIVAEAQVKGGKKKEAVVQCALEACRILDSHGVLRQSKHESKAQRLKPSFDEDYYSSDEDTFLDRTGVVEKKRLAKMKEKSKSIETHESLLSRYQDVLKEISEIQQTLDDPSSSSKSSVGTEEFDDVDAYVKALQASESVKNKKSMAKLRLTLKELQKEESKLQALIKITRPVLLETLPLDSETLSSVNQFQDKSGPDTELPKPVKPKTARIDDAASKDIVTKEKVAEKEAKKTEKLDDKSDGSNLIKKTPAELPKKPESPKETKQVSIKLNEEIDESSDREKVGLVVRKRKKKEFKPPNEPEKKKASNAYPSFMPETDNFDDSKYATWTPPQNQSGDGKNSLNQKYGY